MQLSSYASDALYSAMELADTKAINSFSFRDCQNMLTTSWANVYEKIALIDSGFYSVCVPLTQELTHLPPFLQNTLVVFRARALKGFSRQVYKASGYSDLHTSNVYHISGNDLYCPDATRTTMWLEYIPTPPLVTFTLHNRDPKILTYATEPEPQYLPKIPGPLNTQGICQGRYGLYDLIYTPGATEEADTYVLKHKVHPEIEIDITLSLKRDEYTLRWFHTPAIPSETPRPMIILDASSIEGKGYAFVTYKHSVTGDYESYLVTDLESSCKKIKYNPFDFAGRGSHVRFITAKYNTFTGMGVTIQDYDAPDSEKYKELGWTPDTALMYPDEIIYRYMVALLAERFAAKNESNIMSVAYEKAAVEREIAQFLKRNQSGFHRIHQTTGPTIADWL